MDIAEELRQAHVEYLQDAWDRWLINGWKMGSVMTGYSVDAFKRQQEITSEIFYALKRTPRCKSQHYTRLTRFIAAYLPALNNLLWSDKYTIDQILAAIKPIDTLMNPADAQKVAKERKEEKKAVKDANAYSSLRKLRADARLATSKSNWGTCK